MIDKDVFLVQTDTTVGFISKDHDKLIPNKRKKCSKKTFRSSSDLKNIMKIQEFQIRFKNKVRRSKKTTFIYPNKKVFRVVQKGFKS